MNKKLEAVAKRLGDYESVYAEVLQQFHDTDTLNYFNDRFGEGNPHEKNANRGIDVEKQLRTMKVKIEKFADELLTEFPSIKKN